MSLEPQHGPGAEENAGPPALSLARRPPALAAPRSVATTPLEIDASDPREPAMSARLLQLWNIVMKWRWPITAIASLGVAAGVIATMMTTPIYRATTTIQIDTEPAKVQAVATQQNYSYDDPEKYYLTQYELLKSRALAERVADKLADDDALLNPPETKPFWSRILPSKPPATTPSGHAVRTAIAAGMVMGGLTIQPVRLSRLVRISFDSPDPGAAARVANAVAASFISWNLERRFEA
ncbi:MAG TPA: Wzz/FepE/Etk N-terminal domain-containing protein, partial [Caulobacteraceae bacterium]